jgi:3-oxoacyl-[acyl-carrier protein] reductase
MNRLNLSGKIVLITGANGGIGSAIAKSIIEYNGIPILHYHKNNENVVALTAEYNKKGIKLYSCNFDIRNEKEVKEGIKSIIKEFGHLDSLVNNAGIVSRGFIPTLSLNTLNKVLDTNVIGNFSVLKNVAQVMINQKYGNIVNISSLAGSTGLKGQAAYSMSKASIDSMTRIAAKELAMYNVRVNAVAPGYVSAGMLENPSEQDIGYMRQIPMKRYAYDYEVADLVTFLLSDASSYITGQILVIDGGLSISL